MGYKFKKGDKVKLINETSAWRHKIGDIGIIAEDCNMPYVTFEDGDKEPFDEKYLELVSEETKSNTYKFKIGDTIKYIGNQVYVSGNQLGKVIAIDEDDAQIPYKILFHNTNKSILWLSEIDLKLIQTIKSPIKHLSRQPKGITKRQGLTTYYDEPLNLTKEQIEALTNVKLKPSYCSCNNPMIEPRSTAGNMIITKANTYDFCTNCKKEYHNG